MEHIQSVVREGENLIADFNNREMEIRDSNLVNRALFGPVKLIGIAKEVGAVRAKVKIIYEESRVFSANRMIRSAASDGAAAEGFTLRLEASFEFCLTSVFELDYLLGDKFLYDSFHFKEIENMAIGYLEIRAKWVVKGNVDVDIGTNPSAKGGEYDEGVDDQAVKGAALMLSQLASEIAGQAMDITQLKNAFNFILSLQGSRRKAVASLYTLV
ncbi:hypothetical protein CASFOL_021355 [Castilleja foliolosa]|uniref:Uncharacterized protein n=1 Tax=Castilleja foliolosa TaxID=1961234 RepID=A0ABD3CZS5_9LAMI